MALGAFPAFFTALLGLYFLGLKLRLVPDPARLRQRRHPRLQLDVPVERVPPRAAADPRDRRRVHRRLGAEHAHGDDQHDRRGLRDDGAREGPARPPRDDALRGTERDPAAAERLRRRCSRAPSAGSSSSSTSSATRAPATRSSRRCSGTTTRSRRRCSSCSRVCVIVANLIMDILNFILDPRLRTS